MATRGTHQERSGGSYLLAIVLVTLLFPMLTAASDWPMRGYDAQHTGVTSDDPGSELELAWKYKTLKSVRSSPVIVGDTVYVGSDDKRVYALDAVTGEKRWAYLTSGAVSSSPSVVDGVVYVGSEDKNLYALDAATGEKVWSFATYGAVLSSPVVADGVIYIGSADCWMYAVDAASGRGKWEVRLNRLIASSAAVAEGTVLIGAGGNSECRGFKRTATSQQDGVYALDAASGKESWMKTSGWGVASSPAVDGIVVYYGAWKEVYARDIETGDKVWSFTTDSTSDSSPAIAGGLVIIGAEDGKVYALDTDTGAKVWTFPTGDKVRSSPAVGGDIVYVGSDNGYVFGLDTASGRKVWSYKTKGAVESTPAISGGTVFVGSNDGYVYAFREGGASTPVPTPTTTPKQDSPSPSASTAPAPSAVPSQAPGDNGSFCTNSSKCDSGNCANGVCCLTGKLCCVDDSYCDLDHECDRERYYCVTKAPTPSPTPAPSPTVDPERIMRAEERIDRLKKRVATMDNLTLAFELNAQLSRAEVLSEEGDIAEVERTVDEVDREVAAYEEQALVSGAEDLPAWRRWLEFAGEYKEMVGGLIAALTAAGYYLHILKRRTIGEEDVKVKRGVTREGNLIKIGVKVINDSTFTLVDVGVELDIPKAFRIDGGSKFIDLGTLKQGEFQSAIFKLVPTRCVSGNITGSVIYHDVKGQRKVVEMQPVTVGSVCPFLEKVHMTPESFNERVTGMASNEKRMTFDGDPGTVYQNLQGKCSSMHVVHEGYSEDGARYTGMYAAQGAYSKNFIAMYMELDVSSNELAITVYGEQEEMITGLLSEIVDIVEGSNSE